MLIDVIEKGLVTVSKVPREYPRTTGRTRRSSAVEGSLSKRTRSLQGKNEDNANSLSMAEDSTEKESEIPLKEEANPNCIRKQSESEVPPRTSERSSLPSDSASGTNLDERVNAADILEQDDHASDMNPSEGNATHNAGAAILPGISIKNSTKVSIQDLERLINSLPGVYSYQLSSSRMDERNNAFVTFENDTMALEAKSKLDGLEFPHGSKNVIKAAYEATATRKRRTNEGSLIGNQGSSVRPRHGDNDRLTKLDELSLKTSKPPAPDSSKHKLDTRRSQNDKSSNGKQHAVEKQPEGHHYTGPEPAKANRVTPLVREAADDLADSFRSAVDLRFTPQSNHSSGYQRPRITPQAHSANMQPPVRNQLPAYSPRNLAAPAPVVSPHHHHLVGNSFHGYPNQPAMHGHLTYPPAVSGMYQTTATRMPYQMHHGISDWDAYSNYYGGQIVPNRNSHEPTLQHSQASTINQAFGHGVAIQAPVAPVSTNIAPNQRQPVAPLTAEINPGHRNEFSKTEGWSEETSDPVSTSRLYVRFDHPFPSDDVLQEAFEKAAPGLEYVSRHMGKAFAFVKYTSAAAAAEARVNMNGAVVHGQKLRVSVAEPPRSGRKRQRTNENNLMGRTGNRAPFH